MHIVVIGNCPDKFDGHMEKMIHRHIQLAEHFGRFTGTLGLIHQHFETAFPILAGQDFDQCIGIRK